jgi:hypothetical protein
MWATNFGKQACSQMTAHRFAGRPGAAALRYPHFNRYANPRCPRWVSPPRNLPLATPMDPLIARIMEPGG